MSTLSETESSPAPEPEGQPVKVLFIIGPGRTGTTILCNVLGELDGFVATGEAHRVWDRVAQENGLCSCGELVRECRFWTAVRRRVTDQGVDWDQVPMWREEAVKFRTIFRLLRQRHDRLERWPVLAAYVEASAQLNRAIAEVGGSRVVVDSSKFPSLGAVLHLEPGIEPYFIHLVRDPRATSYSWQRHKVIPDRNDTMPRFRPAVAVLAWLLFSFFAEAVRKRHPRERSMLLRYEDLVEEPRATLERVARLVGEEPGSLGFFDGYAMKLTPKHMVAGNPNRFSSSGAIELRADDEYLKRLGTWEWVEATVTALPYLHRYGYRLRRTTRGTR